MNPSICKQIQFDILEDNDLNFSYSDNNGDYVFTSSVSSANQFKSKNLKNIFLIIGNYNSIITEDRAYQHSWMVHGRFNHKFNMVIRAEIFTQYGGNRVLDVNERIVAGGGTRFKLFSKDFINLYIGEPIFGDRKSNFNSDTSFFNWPNTFSCIKFFKLIGQYNKIYQYNILASKLR